MTVIRGGLHEYLDRLQLKMNAIDSSLRDDFAVRAAPALRRRRPSAVAARPRSQASATRSTA